MYIHVQIGFDPYVGAGSSEDPTLDGIGDKPVEQIDPPERFGRHPHWWLVERDLLGCALELCTATGPRPHPAN